jgi:ATP-dependent Clp protease ATP-binding subunit ClpA
MTVGALPLPRRTRTFVACLKEALADKVVGQPGALRATYSTLLLQRLGLADATRPASFLFLGPPGVGKTTLAQVGRRPRKGTSAINTCWGGSA